ncbi:MAG: purine-nucleoside phosphorylase [Chloroflexota bacterium]
MIPNFSHARETADFVFGHTEQRPRIGLILGTGLGDIAERVDNAETIPYAVLPYFPQPSVEGHQGDLVLGRIADRSVAVLRGRVHLYEGYKPAEVVFPVQLLRTLGCDTLIVTNAAGALNPSLMMGDLMLIRDHIALPGMVGFSPLLGQHEPQYGPRFIDMASAYDPRLREVAVRVAEREGVPLREGVYVMVAGPQYETPAEVRFLRTIGGDAVGMSTCLEVVAARQTGMRVLGISTITNSPHDAGGESVNHQDVLRVAGSVSQQVYALIYGTLAEIEP